jgi:hypothetical protein
MHVLWLIDLVCLNAGSDLRMYVAVVWDRTWPARGPRATRYAWPCGQEGVKSNQFWAVTGDTIASAQPKTPYCFGVAVGGNGILVDCTSADARFAIGFNGPSNNGTVVHRTSGQCLTVQRKHQLLRKVSYNGAEVALLNNVAVTASGKVLLLSSPGTITDGTDTAKGATEGAYSSAETLCGGADCRAARVQ